MRDWVISNQSLTASSTPIRDRSDGISMSIMSVRSDRLRLLGVEAAPFGDQPLEQRRRLPVVAEPRAIFLHAGKDRRQPDRLGVEHRPAAVPREAETVAVDDVDVAGARREAVLEHP